MRWRSRRRTCRSSCRSASPRPTRSQNITESIGSGPFKMVQDGMGARQQGGLREEHRLRAAQGAAVVGLGRQGRRRSIASSGSTSRTRPPPPRRSTPARSTGGSRCRPISSRCSRKNKDIKVENIDPLGSMGMIRFNFSCIRRSTTRRCARRCSTPSTSRTTCSASPATPKNGQAVLLVLHLRHAARRREVGAEPLNGKRDFDKAKQLIKEAGLQGREDRHHRRDRSADRALAVAAHRRAAAASSGSTPSCRQATGAR